MATKPDIGLEELCVEIIGQCMMNCAHCSSSSTINNPSLISLSKFKEILQDAKQLGTSILEISGGEPLLHPDISSFIQEAAKDFKVRLYTSGFLGKSNSGISKDQLLQFKALGLDRIIFNLEGSTAEVHEGVSRAKGSYSSVLKSIKSAIEAGLWVGAHFVPMKINYHDFRAVAELSMKLNINEVAVLRFVCQGRGKTNKDRLEFNQAEFNQFLNEVVSIRREVGTKLKIRTGCPMNFCSMVDRSITPVQCKAGISTLLISYDGTAVPCPAFKHAPQFAKGNIFRQSLRSIWNDSAELEQLRSLDVSKIAVCNSCSESNYCQGRCVAQRFYTYGTIYQGPDPLCPFQSANPNARPVKQAIS